MTEIPGMVERQEKVARAICYAAGRHCHEMHVCDRGPPCKCRYWFLHNDDAGAAIAAHEAALSDAGMVIVPREPTEEMTVAAADLHTEHGNCATDYGYQAYPDEMASIWRAMVDAAHRCTDKSK